MLVEDVEQLEPSHVAGEIGKGTATLENCLAASYKIKHTPIIWPTNLLLGIYPREMKMYTNTCTRSNFIHKHPKLETTQMSPGEEWNCGTSICGGLLSHNKKWTTWIYLKPLKQSKGSQTPKATFYTIPFIWHFWKRLNHGTENTSVVARSWGVSKDWLQRGQGNSEGDKSIL